MGTGINVTNIDDVMKLEPQIVMVGRAIFQDFSNPKSDRAVPANMKIARIEELKARMG